MEGERSVRKEKEGQIALRLFDKVSRNHIIIYFLKIMHNIRVCMCVYLKGSYATWADSVPTKTID